MHLNFKCLFLVVVMLMTACQLVIDADVPYDGDRIVVNAVQEVDSVWAVDLTKTRYILDPSYGQYQTVDEANVVIHKPDGSTETLVHTREGLFKGTTVPEIGKEYSITVDVPGLQTVEGSMKMPPLVKIVDVKWDSSRINDNGVSCNCQRGNVPFDLTLTDPAGEVNYYDVQVYLYAIRSYQDINGNIITDTTANFVQVYVRDPGIANEDESEFSDKTFDGKTHTVPLIAEMILWSGGTYYKSEVRLTTSTEEFYKYNETLELQYEVMGDPFAQPVQVFSNMSNGFGIFTGTATDVRVFKAQEQP